jgi:lipopolysaccharide export system permease protein
MVAIKSLGISPMTLIWPTLVLAVVVSFVAVIINDIAVSWGTMGVRRVFLASIEEVTYGQLRMRRTYNLGNANITVRDVEGHRLIWPTLIVQASGDKSAWTISAEEAELHLLPEEGKLVVKFKNLDLDGPLKWINPETQEYVMSIEELTGASAKNRSPSNYALAEIKPAIHEQEELLGRIDQATVAQAAFGMLTGDFDSLCETAWKTIEREQENAEIRLHRLQTEPWRRWANGFSCLCFVLIGVPVAVWLRFSEFIASFFVCFLPILVAYYPLLAVSVDQAKDGVFPPQSVWLGNILLSLAGIWLLRRVNRN